MDKSETFQPAQHIPTLKALVDAHLFKSGPIVQSSTQKDALEVDEFALLLKQLKYDQAVHETCQQNCKTIYGAREHAKQEMKLNRRKGRGCSGAFLEQVHEADALGAPAA